MGKASKAQEKIQDIISDVLKKVPMANGELKLPKEVVNSLLANVDNIRQGLLNILSKEIERVFSSVDATKITDQLAKNYNLKINAEVSLVPKNSSKKKGKS